MRAVPRAGTSTQCDPGCTLMSGVKNVLVVMSGKGGVGKSSVTVQLAISLAHKGVSVGIIDADLCGPSLPRMFNIGQVPVQQGPRGWIPVSVPAAGIGDLKLMSLSFLLPNLDDAVIWRGPKKTSMISQFVTSVDWGDLDVLLVDTPPGTSDEHLAIVQSAKNARAVIVTTPQVISLQDVERQISFCRELSLPVVGIIENMSGYLCTRCSHCNNVFSSGGGEQLADKHGLPFLGRLHIDPQLARILEGRGDVVHEYMSSPARSRFEPVADSVYASIIN